MDDKKRVSVVMDAELHRQLKITAAEHGVTISEMVTDAIKDKLEDMNNAAEKK